MVSMMQSHPFLICLQRPPCLCPYRPLNHNIAVISSVHLTKDAPPGSTRHCIFHSFPVSLACVFQCFLSSVGSFAIVHQRLDTAYKREKSQNMLAGHSASLTLSVHSPGLCHFCICKGITLKSQYLVGVHSHRH